jgi:hypothetical protein
MKTDEVPQDTAQTYAGVRKLLYAVDESGEYTGVQSAGWEVETYATMAAVDLLNKQRDETLARAHAGQTSPLEFHMYDRRMDLATLAAASGVWTWRIKRHFKPDVFANLATPLLQRYADPMGISVETLRGLPPVSNV